MSISFETYKNGGTNIKHGFDRPGGKHLVLGWLILDRDAETETRFALDVDGKVKKTETRPIGEVWFNKPGIVWSDCDAVPANAEFIGNYVNDMF